MYLVRPTTKEQKITQYDVNTHERLFLFKIKDQCECVHK